MRKYMCPMESTVLQKVLVFVQMALNCRLDLNLLDVILVVLLARLYSIEC